MGRSRKTNTKRLEKIRYFAVCFLWALWLFLALSCLTFNGHQRMWVVHDPNVWQGSGAAGSGADGLVTNKLVGPLGTTLAYEAFENVGPGIFVAIILAAALLVVWSRGHSLSQWSLRVTGCGLLVVVISTVFALMRLRSMLPSGSGGALGFAVGTFLSERFGGAGTTLLIMLTLIVGLLLVADEIMLALPAQLMSTWHRVPKQQLAGAAAGAAGGFWNSFREVMGYLGRPKKIGRGRPLGSGVSGSRISQAPSWPAGAGSSVSVPETEAVVNERVNALRAEEVLETPVETPTPAVEEAKAEELPEKKEREVVVRKSGGGVAGMMPTRPVLVPAPLPKAQDFGSYKIPGLDLLDEAEPINMANHEARVREKAHILEQALESFGIEAKVEAIDTGPVVTLYELALAPGIKSSQVAALSKDVARSLKSPPVRIIDNIPGKSTMGIEVPNLDRERVRLKELMQLGEGAMSRMALPMCLGKDASGNPLIEDLAKIPHLLIAGTTGSGKSVCINSIIMTMLLTQRPDHVKMIMVDPKMVEMQDYKSIPHLMAPIIDDMGKAESILEWATQKMDERYEVLSEAGVRHIKDFNKLTKEQICERFNAVTDDDKAKLVFHLPYIIIIIDELADLMMTSKDVEGHIVRIAQKARAVGIHLILATQRPEAQVVTGLIKSNMPGRICFQVRSRLDSRIMLDQSGGELLLGQGDLLMLKPTGGGMVRGQGTFVDDNEMKRVCKFLKEIAQPEFHPELMQLGSAQGLAEGEEKDPLYNEAVDIMIETGRGSVSLIQRRLNIGYSRASRLIDQMRRTGIVGAYKGSMASEIVVTKEQWEAMKAADAAVVTNGLSARGEEGYTGDKPGMGQSAGYAQQTSSVEFEEDEERDGGVPDELPGEHRM